MELLGPGGIDLLRGRGVHLGAFTRILADRHGTRPAVDDVSATPGLHAGGMRTFVDLEDHVARLAAAHRAAGTGPGDRVLVMMGNRVDVVLHALALGRIGAVPVPVNSRLRDAEVAAVADAAGAKAVVADAEPARRIAASEVDRLAGLGVALTGDEPGVSGQIDLGAWVSDHPDQRVEAPNDLDPSATALLLATSGTTGLPKAAALTSRGLVSSLGRLAFLPVGRARGPRAGRDLVIAALPLTHVMGFACMLGAMSAGVPLLHRAKFDPVEVLDLIEDRRPNLFVGVPTMYADLEHAGAGGRDLSSVQIWGSGADVMPPDRARRFQRFGAATRIAGHGIGDAAFIDVYGMVELSGAAAARVYPPSPVPGVPVPSFAVVLPGIDVRAVDADGAPVGRGQVGELQFRGPGVLQGYEGRSGEGFTHDGWFATGDYGRVWPGGVFSFSGRSKDRLKVGGFSVFPAEVEQELRDHPGVRDVAVVGLPDERLGQRLVAMVVPAEGDFEVGEFLDWAAEHVAGYRRPQECVTVDDLPRGNHGKIDRAAATELAEKRFS